MEAGRPASNYNSISLRDNDRDFPGGPMVETLPSNPRGLCVIPGQGAELRSHMPVVKKQNRNNIVTNSIKILQWSTLKKKILKEKDSLDCTAIAEVIRSSQTGNVVVFFPFFIS